MKDTKSRPAAHAIGSPTVILSKHGVPHALLLQKYKLLIVNGPDQGKEAVIDKEVFTIGAGRQNDLVLQDAAVSRAHCEIQVQAEGFLLRDLNSTNGTLIHGVRICEAYLEHGTEFQAGGTKVVFCPLQEATEHLLSARESFGRLLGRSVAMKRVFHLAERFAPTDTPILIEGETGTGKELLAEAIHAHSRRSERPFSVVDCGTLAKGLVESELFGHVRGAFTGAVSDRVGAFQHAGGGTVFLDEVAELALELQPKLLRVLEKKEVRRVGANELKPVDVRVLAATNKRLEGEINAGRFREDLFYRLSVVKIEMPPLRKRKEDLPLLTRHFLEELGGPDAVARVADFDRTMELFRRHDWPGNVRELKNLIEMAFHGSRDRIDFSSFLYLGGLRERRGTEEPVFDLGRPFKEAKGDLVERFEKEYVQGLLERNRWNVSQAAREARIERAYLQRLIKKHRLSP